MSALSYMDLVISTVRGQSPVPELQNITVDRTIEAKEHLAKVKSKSLMTRAFSALGPKVLNKAWSRLTPPALTMCGDKSINQLLEAMNVIESENIPGDFIETGVWRGGLPIIMRAHLNNIGNKERLVYIADSFQGLPNDSTDPKDRAAHALLDPIQHLSTSRKQVEDGLNFFGLNDNQIVFLEGWFKDTLVNLPDRPIALARLDGDYYESTMDAIETIYPKLSKGGFLIVDDYNLPLGCKRAINEYRKTHNISDEIIKINNQAIYWRKS
jgi:hypothetical protein